MNSIQKNWIIEIFMHIVRRNSEYYVAIRFPHLLIKNHPLSNYSVNPHGPHWWIGYWQMCINIMTNFTTTSILQRKVCKVECVLPGFEITWKVQRAGCGKWFLHTIFFYEINLLYRKQLFGFANKLYANKLYVWIQCTILCLYQLSDCS